MAHFFPWTSSISPPWGPALAGEAVQTADGAMRHFWAGGLVGKVGIPRYLKHRKAQWRRRQLLPGLVDSRLSIPEHPSEPAGSMGSAEEIAMVVDSTPGKGAKRSRSANEDMEVEEGDQPNVGGVPQQGPSRVLLEVASSQGGSSGSGRGRGASEPPRWMPFEIAVIPCKLLRMACGNWVPLHCGKEIIHLRFPVPELYLGDLDDPYPLSPTE